MVHQSVKEIQQDYQRDEDAEEDDMQGEEVLLQAPQARRDFEVLLLYYLGRKDVLISKLDDREGEVKQDADLHELHGVNRQDFVELVGVLVETEQHDLVEPVGHHEEQETYHIQDWQARAEHQANRDRVEHLSKFLA